MINTDGSNLQDDDKKYEFKICSKSLFVRDIQNQNTACNSSDDIANKVTANQIGTSYFHNYKIEKNANELITNIDALQGNLVQEYMIDNASISSGSIELHINGNTYSQPWAGSASSTASAFVSSHKVAIEAQTSGVLTASADSILLADATILVDSYSTTGGILIYYGVDGFANKLHSNALFFKTTKSGRSKIVLDITKHSNCTNYDLVSTATNMRYVIYDNCTSLTPIHSGIFSTSTGVLEVLDVTTYPETFTIAIDTPIHRFKTQTEDCSTCGSFPQPDCTEVYESYLSTACGCFSIFTRDEEYKQVKVSWTKIKINKIEEYHANCTYVIPKVNDCEPVPYRKGMFAYWESTNTYPDNKELYDSSNLHINPVELNGLSYSDKRSFITYYLTYNTVSNGSSLVQGKYYIVKISGDDDFSNIGGFIDQDIFLCTTTVIPNVWDDSEVIEIQVDINQKVILNGVDFTCQPIRHFKFPDNRVAPFLYSEISSQKFADSYIHPIGINLDSNAVVTMLNIARINNLISQKQLDNIQGYEILKGDNSIHKSIIANGLSFDMYNYRKGADKWWYSNFPFNDLGEDKFNLTSKGGGLIQHPFEGNSNFMYSFLSPDLFLTKPTLPTEVSLTGYQFGNYKTRGVEVEEHPKWTVLGRRAKRTATTLAVLEATLETIVKISEILARQWQVFGTSSGFSLGAIGASMAAGGYAVSTFMRIGKYRYQWLQTFRDLGTADNFGNYLVAEGKYNNFVVNTQDNDYVRGLSLRKYLKDNIYSTIDENDGSRVNINSWLREYSTLLSTGESYKFNYLPDYTKYDNNKENSSSSKILVSQIGRENNRDVFGNVASPYMTLKNYIPDQWDTVDTIKWLTTNEIFDLEDDTVCKPLFGGTVTISRFTWKRKVPMYTTTAMGLPDKKPFNYSEHGNIGYPRFYCDYEVSGIFDDYGVPFPDIDSDYNFDCESGRNNFYVKPPSKLYLYSYGIVDFLVESEINCNFRYGRKKLEDAFYPQMSDTITWTQEKNLSITEPNTFYYNNVYSLPVTNTPYKFLYSTYNKEIWEKHRIKDNLCIYSETDGNETDLTDPWKVYKPLNFYEFETKFGKLIDLKDIESNQFLARFENQLITHNTQDNLAERLTPETRETGTSGIFLQRPIEFKSTDLGFLGTQNVDMCSTPYGHYWADVKRGRIFQIDQNGGNLQIISEIVNGQDTNMKQWFREHLPFKILKYIPEIDIDNKFKGIGLNIWYDDRNSRVFFTKRDYILKSGINKNNFIFEKDTNKLLYNGTEVFFDNSELFKDASWTISFKPNQGWDSYFSFYPDYAPSNNNYFQVGYNWGTDKETLWNHTMNNSSFQVFQGRLNPFTVEFPIQNENVKKTLNSIQLNIETKRYQNAWDFSQWKDKGFNKFSIFNNVQHTGQLNLFPQKTLLDNRKYPKTNADKTQDILFTAKDGKHNINYFFNRVIDQDNNIPIFNKDVNNIFKEVNPKAISFKGKNVTERMTGEAFIVSLTNDKESRFNILLKNTENDETIS